MPSIDVPILLVVTLLAGGVAAFLAKLKESGTLAALFLLLGILLAVGLLSGAYSEVMREGAIRSVVGGWQEGVGINLLLDGPALLLLAVVLLVSGAIVLYALGEGGYGPLFYGILAIALAGMVGVILSADLFNLFVFLEVLSLSATMLIAYKKRLPALYAAFRYLLLCTLSVALYLVGLFILYRVTGELSFAAVRIALAGSAVEGPLLLAGVLLFGGVAVRASLVPFHAWIPDAHGQAPHPVSALLSGLVLKAALIALWRVTTLLSGFLPLLTVAGALSAVGGVAAALMQRDAKRLLAFHSISQMGLVAAAAGVGGIAAALYHALGHALFKSLLFLAVGYFVAATGERDLYRMARVPGPRGNEAAALFLIVGSAAIAGVPPFAGFASKSLLGTAFKGGLLYEMLRVVSVGTAASFIKLTLLIGGGARTAVVGVVPGGAGGEAGPGSVGAGVAGAADPADSPLLCLASMAFLSLGVLALGLFPGPLLSLFGSLGVPVAGTGENPYTLSGLLESGLILILGALLFLVIRRPGPSQLLSRLGSRRVGVDGAMALVSGGVIAAVLLVQ